MSVLAEQTGLTSKQQAFVNAYLSNGHNATQAAKTAGYSGDLKQLSVIGNENLNKLCIRNALSYRTTNAIKRTDKRIVDVYLEFQKNLEFVGKLRDASEKWLQHPESDVFSIDPRGDEIDIVYFDYEDKDQSGNPKRKVACLQDVLAKLQGTRYESDAQFIKTVDLREYALKAVDRIETTLDKFAKMGGDYSKEKENPQTLAVFRTTIERLAADPRIETIEQFVEQLFAAIPAFQQLQDSVTSKEFFLVNKGDYEKIQQLKGVQ